MLQVFVMVLREGFEAFLIVAIMLSYLKSTGQEWLCPAVYAAIAVSILTSGFLGYLLMTGINQSLWEGVLGIVTILMVGTLVIQMWRTAHRLKSDIQGRLRQVASKTSRVAATLGVFLFALLMITREGMETALMLLQVREGDMLAGILLGLLGAVSLSWMWLRYGRLINLKRFFQVTGIFLILFMVQVAVYSFHEFSEAGLLPDSERLHELTEPFSPYGLYGRWFSFLMVAICALWLAVVSLRDQFASKKS